MCLRFSPFRKVFSKELCLKFWNDFPTSKAMSYVNGMNDLKRTWQKKNAARRSFINTNLYSGICYWRHQKFVTHKSVLEIQRSFESRNQVDSTTNVSLSLSTCVVSKNNEHLQDTDAERPKTVHARPDTNSTPRRGVCGRPPGGPGTTRGQRAETRRRPFSLSTLAASVGEPIATLRAPCSSSQNGTVQKIRKNAHEASVSRLEKLKGGL